MFWKKTHRILGLKIKYVLYQSSGFQQGFFYSLRGQSAVSGDIFDSCDLAGGVPASRPAMLLSILQCTGQHLTPRNYLVPNAKCPLLRNLDLKGTEGKTLNSLMVSWFRFSPTRTIADITYFHIWWIFFTLLYYSLLCGNFKYSSLNKRELSFSLPYYISYTKGFTKSISYNLQYPCKRHYSYLSGKLKNRTSRLKKKYERENWF